MSPKGRPEGEYRSEKREGSPVSLRARVGGDALPWLALAAVALVAGAWLRARGLSAQIVIDDEWHALHTLLRADMLDVVTHLDYADYSIPLTVYFRWLHDTVGVTEWGMRAPMLAAGIVLVVAAPALARAWAPPPVRAAWTVLLAVSPLLVYFSRTARPYALTALLATVALIAFERWYRGDRRRDAWGALYVAATFVAGWLHMTSLAFVLLPFAYFGVRALRAGGGEPLRRLVRMGIATALPLLLALAPPVVNDWFMFTAKAGVDSVTPASAGRTALMLAGSAHAIVAILMGAATAAGAVRVWRRDRVLAGYLLTVMIGGTLAILAARPNWVQHPLVFARYLVPALPLLLLLAAEGALALAPLLGRVPALGATTIAAAGLALWHWGPLPAHAPGPNQFTGHLRYQFDYDDAHNPYVLKVPDEPVPAFYRELAQSRPGSLTLIEAPWRLESHHNPHVWYQQVHRQHVLIGLVTPLCGVRNFGEYPETQAGMRLANFAHLTAILRGQSYGADFLVVHVKPWSTPPEASVPWPDVAHCLPAIESALGPPFYVDERIVVFALPGGVRPGPARAK
ncbi:MAG: hypothetical protein IT517_08995 [Burkholderiales bacterium]|nr:hypothetical protein [Burkholderiales bacterium]